MILNTNSINAIAGTYIKSVEKISTRVETNAANANSKDEILLSNASQDFAPYLHKLSAMADMSAEKAENYKTAINSGKYEVDSQGTANDILDLCTLK
ncbi:flagellar biosynthesis anti-sigma factor FlgM [Pectinatus brassicae]|uniref:Anti-sigma28 factor (Negative regulator of flagellin synthesis) n=1 Tax=Pectinatus brassicae TaxID=862415 RepID=A0A840URP3_9FIRM|nr:flagellar biosynthesis anti-sigma factor FlgM [Pectinatus brassicae]MBB5336822.1 anti-sigma28 factor (negative regulator of flagellin synthesis) [Pectinatus brassicae]